jgi:hypothetical protein
MGPDDTAKLTSGVPKLDIDGANWSSWKTHILSALGSARRGVLTHIEEVVPLPNLVPPLGPGPHTEAQIDKYKEKLEKYQLRIEEHRHQESIVKNMIFKTVSAKVFMEVRKLATAKEIWNAVCAKYKDRRMSYKLTVREELMALKCTEEGKIEDHLIEMMTLQDRLTSMDDVLTDKEYVSKIMRSLLRSYMPLVMTMSVSARQNSTVPRRLYVQSRITPPP